MQYQSYDLLRKAIRPLNFALQLTNDVVSSEKNPISHTRLGRLHSAVLESSIRILKHYPKQGFLFDDVEIDGNSHAVKELIQIEKPFGNLLQFKRAGLPDDAPKVIFVAALSGHHATLSRETFEQFLPDHEVYVTDWLDAKDVPLSEGRFGFSEYIQYVIEFMELIGPNTHMIALCQAAVPALVAAAYMSKHKNEARPKSMTLIAGPVDVRINSNDLIKKTKYFSQQLIQIVALHKVPKRYKGAGRVVYPGALQLGGFMSLNITGHIEKHLQFFKDITLGNIEEADKHREFYDEYFAVMDATAEFYLETLERVFIDQHLPKGLMIFNGEMIDCSEITDIPILTMEGADDNMVSVGMTQAALKLCQNLPESDKHFHVQEGVGHYGIFSGTLFRKEVAPRVKSFISDNQQKERP